MELFNRPVSAARIITHVAGVIIILVFACLAVLAFIFVFLIFLFVSASI